MMTVGLRPNAIGPGESGATLQSPAKTDPAARTAKADQVQFSPGANLGPEPVQPPPEKADAARIGDNASERISRSSEASQDTSEAPPPIPSEPAGPLKTYAQIPTEMMQEISRLREEAAETTAQGVPGRNDPTPMPASPQAIGTQGVPYGAA